MSEQDTAKLIKEQVGQVAADRLQSGSKAKVLRLGHSFPQMDLL